MTEPQESNESLSLFENPPPSKVNAPKPKPGEINFTLDGIVPLTLTKKGFIYKGQIIKEAGQARRLFMKVCKQMEIINGNKIMQMVKAKNQNES